MNMSWVVNFNSYNQHWGNRGKDWAGLCCSSTKLLPCKRSPISLGGKAVGKSAWFSRIERSTHYPMNKLTIYIVTNCFLDSFWLCLQMFARTDINVQPVSFHEREAGGLGLRRQCQIHLELISAAKAVRGASTVDKKINFVISKLNVFKKQEIEYSWRNWVLFRKLTCKLTRIPRQVSVLRVFSMCKTTKTRNFKFNPFWTSFTGL